MSEGDATAASYFSALATIHNSSVYFPNLGSNTVQGDYFFFEVMEQLGAKVERTEQSTRYQARSSSSLRDRT